MQGTELSATMNQFGQIGCLCCFLRSDGGLHQLSKFSQDFSIDRVCLGKLTQSAGKVSYLSGINYNNRQTCVQQFGDNWFFVAAGGFQDDSSDREFLEVLAKLTMTLRCVWQRGFQNSGAASNTEGVFCDIDTDINGISHPVDRLRHGFLPYLQMRTRQACGLLAVQTAVRASPTVAARILLCDGLADLDTNDLSSPIGVGSAALTPPPPPHPTTHHQPPRAYYNIYYSHT